MDKLTCACHKCTLSSIHAIVDRYDDGCHETHYLDECAVWKRDRRVGGTVRRLLAKRSSVACEALRDKYHNYKGA